MPKFQVHDSLIGAENGDSPLWIGDAATPLDALDAYSFQEGFSSYRHPENTEAVYTLPDGRIGAVFTNYEIVATLVTTT